MNSATLRRILASEAREAGVDEGRITAEHLVQRTRDKKHPLHGYIWHESDAVAAHQRRLDLARALIRRVEMEISTSELAIKAPYFVRDVTLEDRQQGYRATHVVRDDREAARETLVRELTTLAAMRTRVLSLASALDLEAEAREAMSAMEDFALLVRESARKKKPAKAVGSRS